MMMFLKSPTEYGLFKNWAVRCQLFLPAARLGSQMPTLGFPPGLFRATVAVHHTHAVDANTTQARRATSTNPSRGHASHRSQPPFCRGVAEGSGKFGVWLPSRPRPTTEFAPSGVSWPAPASLGIRDRLLPRVQPARARSQ